MRNSEPSLAEGIVGFIAAILGLATGLGITALVIWLCVQAFA